MNTKSYERLVAQNRTRLSQSPSLADPAAEAPVNPPASIAPTTGNETPPLEEPESDAPAEW